MNARRLHQAAGGAPLGSPSVRRLAPFAAVVAIGVLASVPGAEVDPLRASTAGGLALAAGMMIVLLPWRSLPHWAGTLPALLFLAAVAFFRDGVGGSITGLGPLVLLPVLWLAMYGTRLQLGVIVPAVGITLAAPIVLIGGPDYPDSQWRMVVTHLALALLLGPMVQRLIGRVRAQAAEARAREREVARVAQVARRLSTGDGTRRDVCTAACEIGDASFALLWEPGPSGRLVVTAAAGIEEPAVELDPEERSGTAIAYRTAAPVFVADAEADPAVSARLLDELTGPFGSVLFQPVLRRGAPAGVLVVGWRGRVDDTEERLRTMVGLLAAEAGIAIERADVMTRLEELADTDELTGLPNRRGWNRELDVALSTARRHGEPLCIALIDLDFFKDLNDERGHLAGDRLLKSAAAAWRSTLRPGDVLARHGGDEFTLLLPHCDIARARTVLERLRGATPESTCSVGVAQWDGSESAEQLVARADEALYAAKDGGRDRIVAA